MQDSTRAVSPIRVLPLPGTAAGHPGIELLLPHNLAIFGVADNPKAPYRPPENHGRHLSRRVAAQHWAS